MKKEGKHMWLKFFGSVMVLVGALLIFDGRRIVKKHFQEGDENLATSGIKIFGFLIAIMGGFLMM